MRLEAEKITLWAGILVLALSCSSCQVAEKGSTKTAYKETTHKENSPIEKLVYLNAENAVASSFDDTPDWAPQPNPMAPVDSNMLTRWSSKLGLDNQWIYFDLGKEKVISKITIKWESAYAVDYEILTSLNG
ncbi:MAG: discoidin domain-containing protein, partial [Candidatus Omnitrophica bacterium]|nr:discoidin domain-containing protein [Candidatus Omnitrophota bacterium]